MNLIVLCFGKSILAKQKSNNVPEGQSQREVVNMFLAFSTRRHNNKLQSQSRAKHIIHTWPMFTVGLQKYSANDRSAGSEVNAEIVSGCKTNQPITNISKMTKIIFFTLQTVIHAVLRNPTHFFHAMIPQNPRLHKFARASSMCSAQKLHETFCTSEHSH